MSRVDHWNRRLGATGDGDARRRPATRLCSSSLSVISCSARHVASLRRSDAGVSRDARSGPEACVKVLADPSLRANQPSVRGSLVLPWLRLSDRVELPGVRYAFEFMRATINEAEARTGE